MDFKIQLLDSGNSELLERLDPDVFDNAIDALQLRDFLDDPRHFMFIAVVEGTVVGMASAVELFHPDKTPQVFINEVGVASAYRKQGIGRSLVQAVLDASRARGCVYAWLGTDIDNKAAQACFGSVPAGKEPQTFLLYEWELEGS